MSFVDRSTPTSPLDRGVDPDKDLLAQVKSLLKERKLLEVGHAITYMCSIFSCPYDHIGLATVVYDSVCHELKVKACARVACIL